MNSVQLKTDFSRRRFLVYNDNFYPGWRVFVNGREEKLYRANYAFKGVWVDPGEWAIEFRFGSPGRIMLGYGLMAVFALVLLLLILFWRRSDQLSKNNL